MNYLECSNYFQFQYNMFVFLLWEHPQIKDFKEKNEMIEQLFCREFIEDGQMEHYEY